MHHKKANIHYLCVSLFVSIYMIINTVLLKITIEGRDISTRLLRWSLLVRLNIGEI